VVSRRRPKGADLTEYPKALLLSNPATAVLHTFGMEFKEHVAWIAPILATAVAYIVFKYGPQLADHPRVRQAAITLFTLAFTAAAFAGLYGALITKAVPVH
jgi:hypothetical protein